MLPQDSSAPPASRSPGDSSTITEATAEELVHGICFKTGPPRTLGAELEWLVLDAERPGEPLSPERLTAAHDAARALPLNSRFSIEPGGQLELSSAPAASLSACLDGLRADLAAVRGALHSQGLVLHGTGLDRRLDRRCPPRRLLSSPRYDAMETYLDRFGPAGRAMMCSTASVQVCVDAGYEEPGPLGYGRRWRLAHLLGAVFVAAFANSPAREGPYAGWRCARQGIWGDLDSRRALAPALDADPRTAWTRHALDTEVMCVRSSPEGSAGPSGPVGPSSPADPAGPWSVPRGLTFRDWLRAAGSAGDAASAGRPAPARGAALRPPTAEDLQYHLTTLFPPVRPRGHLELRMIDAQPGDDGWLVPVAVVHALFDDPEAAGTGYRVAKALADAYGPRHAPCNPLWQSAARHGLADPDLRAAAATCFRAAAEALPRLGASRPVQDAVGAFTERFVLRGRCPADEAAERDDQLTGTGAHR